MVAVGYTARACAALESAGVAAATFSAFDHDPTSAMVDAGAAAARAAGRRLARGAGRRQLDGLRQGDRLPARERRPHAGLPRLREGEAAAAADDRDPDDGRHRQRGAVLRARLGRRHPREDGLRRQERRVPRRDPRSRARRLAAARRDRGDRLRRDRALGRDLGLERAHARVRPLRARGLSPARRPLRARPRGPEEPRGALRPRCWRRTGPARRSRPRCSARRTPAPTR